MTGVDSPVLSGVDEAAVRLCRWVPAQHQVHVEGGQADVCGAAEGSGHSCSQNPGKKDTWSVLSQVQTEQMNKY